MLLPLDTRHSDFIPKREKSWRHWAPRRQGNASFIDQRTQTQQKAAEHAAVHTLRAYRASRSVWSASVSRRFFFEQKQGQSSDQHRHAPLYTIIALQFQSSSDFGFRTSDFFRHSSFVIRHLDFNTASLPLPHDNGTIGATWQLNRKKPGKKSASPFSEQARWARNTPEFMLNWRRPVCWISREFTILAQGQPRK